ncbi:MAG TPA: alpha-hydroxy acid oxidase [Acidimicrobiales bacterium]
MTDTRTGAGSDPTPDRAGRRPTSWWRLGPDTALGSVLRFRELELDPVARRLARVASIDDLRRLARRRLPRGVFDYIDGGAEAERTLVANVEAFARRSFRPRVLRDVGDVDPSTTLLGRPLPIPLVLSPTGFSRIADPDGELAVARAAARAGLPYTLSTLATRSIEEVAAASGDGARWFQVYVWRDRGLVRSMIERAEAAGYEALVVTVDTAVLGKRERDVRRGFSLPPKLGLGTLVDGALHPGWTWDFVRAEPIRFANVVGADVPQGDGTAAVSLAEYVNQQFDPTLSWTDLDWMRTIWDGPIVVKGIQTVEDARLAVDAGVEAIALSNHGGRQLDTAPTPIDLVEPVVQAVGDAVAVLCDGGVRRGSDIVKAVALGATACMAGRAYLYGLGAGGERGVDTALALLDADVRRTMALIGARTVGDLARELVE